MFGNTMEIEETNNSKSQHFQICSDDRNQSKANASDEKSTRDLIVDAALSFYKKPLYTDFSLSEVAAKVGISKTAIFRHFKNKNDLLAAMQEKLIDKIYEQVVIVTENFKKQSCTNGTLQSIAPALAYFACHPEYSSYLVGQFLSSPNFESVIVQGCKDRGFVTEKVNRSADNKITVRDYKKYTASIYLGVSLFFWLQVRFKEVDEGKTVDNPESFSKKSVQLLEKGLVGSVSKANLHYPQKISEERLVQLDSFCKIDDSQLPQEDRIFTALASVINKDRFPGVTVQKIADELHMAKSSLYSYFNNKNELIRSLIDKEIQAMTNLIQQNCENGLTDSEKIYITLRT